MNKQNKKNQLLIIGNGFDLECGLRSKYIDFFKWRFEKLFFTEDEQKELKKLNKDQKKYFFEKKEIKVEEAIENKIKKNSIGSLKTNDFFKMLKSNWKSSNKIDINQWDYIFLFAKKYLYDIEKSQWQDIENIIYNVVSIALRTKNFNSNLRFKNKKSGFIRLFPYECNKKGFYKIIRQLVSVQNNNKKEIAIRLLKELNNFEDVFATYIEQELEKSDDHHNYIRNAAKLLESLIKDDSEYEVDVLSFNYTINYFLNKNFSTEFDKINKIKNLRTWTNIHGISNSNYSEKDKNKRFSSPIFGIDNHNIIKSEIANKENTDLRMIFTKSYRLIDDQVNNLSNIIGYNKFDLITVYGHSLGQADYSYFETIFDNCDLYKCNTKLQFYFYQEKEKMGESLENCSERNKLKKREYFYAIENLLINYGITLSEKHGENIINHLLFEGCLEVIHNPEIKKLCK